MNKLKNLIMKKTALFTILLLFIANSFGQVINVNPDPNGEPWIVGGWREPTPQEIAKIPDLQITPVKSAKDLPSSLDNSTLEYFRPVFNQTDGCCAQASGIAYNFTYEINRANQTAANTPDHQFPTHYTYNFLNGGSGSNGSFYTDGWNIIADNGCPTVADYGGLAQDPTYWMSGYDLYKNAMPYRVTQIFKIHIENENDLLKLKTWMYNHGDNSQTGGLVNFAAGVYNTNFNMTENNIITSWGNPVNHAMTFVGWDDSIGYDVNDDGQITNDIDITGDGIVDMRDWERGAMIMVNSWGTSWGDNGKAYVLYRLLALPSDQGGIGGGNCVYSIKVNPQFEKQLFMKFKISDSSRNKISISAGVSSDTNATIPDKTIDFSLFHFQGGNFPMGGQDSTNPVEIALDITPLLSYVESGQSAKFFLIVQEQGGDNNDSGTVYNYSIVDNQGNEYISPQTNVAIANDTNTYLSVVATPSFDAPEIVDDSLPFAIKNQYYTHQVSCSGGQSPYKWGVLRPITETSISESFPSITSNPVTLSDNDDGYGMQVIDFDFPFFGKMYDTLYIRSDGSITFEPGFDYVRSESAVIANKIISVFASDLMIYPADGDGIFYEGDATHATFRWKTALWSNESANVDVAVTLYPNGNIKFYYGDGITPGLSWAAGVSAGDNSNYYITSESGNYDPSNSQIKLTPSPFPNGMFLANDGTFYGTPTKTGQWNIIFQVTDNHNITRQKTLNFKVANTESDIAENHQKISIYPNPTDGIVNFDIINNNTSIEIFDYSGKLIKRIDNLKTNQIDISDFANGIYILKFKTDKKIFYSKVVKR